MSDSTKALTAGFIVCDSLRTSADGYGTGRLGRTIHASNPWDVILGRNVEFDTASNLYGYTGDGICLIGMANKTADGDIVIACGPDGTAAGTAFDGTGTDEIRMLMRSGLSPTVKWDIDGVSDVATISSIGLSAINQPGEYSAPATFNAEVNDGVLTSATSTVAYSTNNAAYTQIGKTVFFSVEIIMSSLGNLTVGANTARITLGDAAGGDTLPTPAYDATCSVMAQGLDTASFLATDAVVGHIAAGSAPIVILQNYSTTGGCTPLTTTELLAASTIIVSGSYITS
jgi:hypothetical protein